MPVIILLPGKKKIKKNGLNICESIALESCSIGGRVVVVENVWEERKGKKAKKRKKQ